MRKQYVAEAEEEDCHHDKSTGWSDEESNDKPDPLSIGQL